LRTSDWFLVFLTELSLQYSVYSILGRSFMRPGRINEPVLNAIKNTAATSFHGTADPDTKHVPPLSYGDTASVATAPHTIPPPSNYHLLSRGPFPPTDHELPQSCWRGLSVATNKIAAVMHTQLHGILPVADSVRGGLSAGKLWCGCRLCGGVGGRERPCGGDVVCRRG